MWYGGRGSLLLVMGKGYYFGTGSAEGMRVLIVLTLLTDVSNCIVKHWLYYRRIFSDRSIQ
jgi:hypothetical protein